MTMRFRSILLILLPALFWAPFVKGDCPLGDLNGDCRVDFADLEIMMRHWLEEF